jgi:uroporphyrinogen-III synthase
MKELMQKRSDFKKLISIITAIILTSRNSVDHFFRVDEMRFKVPEGLKYFCQSAVAFYLQKYVVYRKRKIYVGPKDFADLSLEKKI